VDAQLTTLLKIIETPEREKMWNPSVKQSTLLFYFPSNSSSVLLKEETISKDQTPIAHKVMTYHSDVINNVFFVMEQTIERPGNTSYETLIDIVVFKQRGPTRTEI